MNTTPDGETLLKTDVLGRVKTPSARREELLDEFARSGLSGQKFAALVGVKYQTFATWAQRRRKTVRPAAKPLRLLEAVVEQPEVRPALVLHLPGGTRVEITAEQQVKLAAALVRSLAQAC